MPTFKNVSPFGDVVVATSDTEQALVKYGESIIIPDGPLATALVNSIDFEQADNAKAASSTKATAAAPDTTPDTTTTADQTTADPTTTEEN